MPVPTAMFRAIVLLFVAVAGHGQFPPLHVAIRNGDFKTVAALVGSGADVNAADAAGTPPLIAAVLSNHSEIVRFLLTHGSNPDARQRETDGTAIYYAVLKGHADSVRALLAAKANTEFRYQDGQTVLHFAAKRDDAPIAQLLIAGGASLSDLDTAGSTPLDEAVLHGRVQTVEVLLTHGANPNQGHGPNARGPLDEAAVGGFARVAELLIQSGADPAARDNSGQSALDLALAYKSADVVQALFRLAPSRPGLRQQFAEAMENTVARGRTTTAKLLLDSGWNANERTSNGSTYLNDAALKGRVGLVRLLLEHGASIDSRNAQGGTPLHDAAISGSPELVNLLIEHGATVDARDKDSGATPLMLAASLGNSAAVAALLQHGANALLVDTSGRTALARAREAQNLELVKLLENVGKPAAKS